MCLQSVLLLTLDYFLIQRLLQWLFVFIDKMTLTFLYNDIVFIKFCRGNWSGLGWAGSPIFWCWETAGTCTNNERIDWVWSGQNFRATVWTQWCNEENNGKLHHYTFQRTQLGHDRSYPDKTEFTVKSLGHRCRKQVAVQSSITSSRAWSSSEQDTPPPQWRALDQIIQGLKFSVKPLSNFFLPSEAHGMIKCLY